VIAVLLLVLSALYASTAGAQVTVDQTLDGQRIEPMVRYLEDPTGLLTLEQVQQRAASFQVPPAAGLNFGLSRRGVAWVRIPVRNPSAEPGAWVLELAYSHIDKLSLFLPSSRGTERRDAGDLLPFSRREREHHNFVFALEEPARSQRVLYLRAETRGLLFLPLRAWQERLYTQHAYLEWTILFAFYGIVLVMAAYNLFLFAMSRLPEYGLFAAVILAEGFTQLASYGHAFQWLLPDQTALAQRMVPFSLTLSVFANCLFGRHNIIVGKISRRVRATVDLLIPTTGLCALLTLVAPYSGLAVLVGFCYLGLVPFAAVVAISWRIQRAVADDLVSTGWANAMLFGWLSVIVGVAVTGLSISGHIDSNAFTLHGFMFGASLQFVLITAGLSNRLGWLQTELVKGNELLQGKVGDLNTAIDFTQTEVARAAAAARAQGEVVATMTHELRTPLNAIINIPQGLQQDFVEPPCVRCGACDATFELDEGEPLDLTITCPDCGKADTLVRGVLPEYVGDPARSIRYLSIIEKAGHHLLSVVQRILDPATESGDLQFARIEALPLLSEVIEQMSAVATQAGVALRLDVAAECLCLRADPLRLRQILINLIGNALKFSDGKGVVTVRVRVDDKMAVFSVQDQGIGIAEDKRAGIFESFEQAHDPGLRRFGGTGLGLSIARSLVSLHGGEIWLESKLGHGTTFHFSIPLAVGSIAPPHAQAS